MDHRLLHEALVGLGRARSGSSVLPSLAGSPDPDVGLRVPGVTAAVWSLVAAGLFEVREYPGGAKLLVSESGLPVGFRTLMRLGAADRAAVYDAAERWACASTARKNLPSAAVSPGAARRSSDLNCRQSTLSARRQRAVSST
jgi:hypothetical protein